MLLYLHVLLRSSHIKRFLLSLREQMCLPEIQGHASHSLPKSPLPVSQHTNPKSAVFVLFIPNPHSHSQFRKCHLCSCSGQNLEQWPLIPLITSYTLLPVLQEIFQITGMSIISSLPFTASASPLVQAIVTSHCIHHGRPHLPSLHSTQSHVSKHIPVFPSPLVNSYHIQPHLYHDLKCPTWCGSLLLPLCYSLFILFPSHKLSRDSSHRALPWLLSLRCRLPPAVSSYQTFRLLGPLLANYHDFAIVFFPHSTFLP